MNGDKIAEAARKLGEAQAKLVPAFVRLGDAAREAGQALAAMPPPPPTRWQRFKAWIAGLFS